MAEKKNQKFIPPLPKNNRIRPSTTTIRKAEVQSAMKERSSSSRIIRPSKNVTITNDLDTTVSSNSNVSYEEDFRQIAYGKFLRSMLEDCLFEDKIERQQTEIDIAMGQLAARFEQSVDLLNKTCNRVKDISFTCEQQRLLNLKKQDTSEFYQASQSGNHEENIKTLINIQETYLNQLVTKNVDFGYNEETGHKQLLDAINDCLKGFDDIKKQSKLDASKLTEYEKCEHLNEELEKDSLDLEKLKKEFEAKFPNFREKVLLDASAKISKLVTETDYEDDTDEGSLHT